MVTYRKLPLCIAIIIVMCAWSFCATAFDRSWGTGMLIPVDVSGAKGKAEYLAYQAGGIQFPPGPVPVFNHPNGKQIGQLIKEKTSSSTNIFLELKGGGTPQRIHVNNGTWFEWEKKEFVSCAYSTWCLRIYRQQTGYVQVLRNSYRQGVWIRAADLRQAGYEPVDYFQWLVHEQQRLHGLRLSDRGITLRESPGFASRKIAVIPQEQAFNFVLEFTGRINGVWAEAELIYYTDKCGLEEEHPLYPDDHTLSGWIKVLDEQGFPNLWYDTEGC